MGEIASKHSSLLFSHLHTHTEKEEEKKNARPWSHSLSLRKVQHQRDTRNIHKTSHSCAVIKPKALADTGTRALRINQRVCATDKKGLPSQIQQKQTRKIKKYKNTEQKGDGRLNQKKKKKKKEATLWRGRISRLKAWSTAMSRVNTERSPSQSTSLRWRVWGYARFLLWPIALRHDEPHRLRRRRHWHPVKR